MGGAAEPDGDSFRYHFGAIWIVVPRQISNERLGQSWGHLKASTAESKTVLCWASNTKRPVEPMVSLMGLRGVSPIFSKHFSVHYLCFQCLQCYSGARLHTPRRTSSKSSDVSYLVRH